MHPQRISASSEATATQGFTTIPNSVVENQLLMTPAELRLVLIVCRRGENTVSDQHWSNWTGLSPRIKANAIKGLKDKGLTVRGHGNTAKYYFEQDRWNTWLRSRPRREKARVFKNSPRVQTLAGDRQRGKNRIATRRPLTN